MASLQHESLEVPCIKMLTSMSKESGYEVSCRIDDRDSQFIGFNAGYFVNEWLSVEKQSSVLSNRNFDK